jgi:dipeptidyl aminopeptidase/acylaminoacyl peptidase
METPSRLLAFGLLFALGFANPLPAQSRADELALIFRPFETDQVTLSPDGRHLAYTERAGEKLDLVIRDLDANRLVRVPVGEARAEELSGAKEKTPARLTFLQWATPERLVFNLNDRNVWSVKADGTGAKRLADPRDFQDLPEPLVPSNQPPPPPGPVLDDVKALDQPIKVAALPRGGKYVYVEALMLDRKNPFRPGVPRAVIRVDVETGKHKEMGEVMERATEPLVDRTGRPRLARLRAGQRSLQTDFLYGGSKGDKWLPLDRLLGPGLALNLNYTPANFLGERSVPLAFDHNPDLLYFASNLGRDTYGIYAIDLKKKIRTTVAIETPLADFFSATGAGTSPLIFDEALKKLVGVRYTGAERATAWLDPELAEVQQVLKQTLRDHIPEIIEWDDQRQRFLVFASSQSDPGTYYVFNRPHRTLDEVMQRAPWLPETLRNPGMSFAFRTAEGVNLTGYLTLPKQPRLKRAPLVALCHDGPWLRDHPGYNRWVQALASMGFAVVQVNYRGSTGFGRKHLQALREAPDRVAVADLMAAVDWAIQSGRVHPKLVATMGEGYGGYLALRAMQLHPDRFRCAVTLNAPTDLAVWANPPADDTTESLDISTADLPATDAFTAPNAEAAGPGENENDAAAESSRGRRPSRSPGDTLSAAPRVLGARPPPGRNFTAEMRQAFFGSDASRLRAISPRHFPEQINGPVMIIQADTASSALGRQFVGELRQLEKPAVFLALNQDQAADLPQARAALFTEIEGFFNEHIYNYSVKLGETVVLP